MANRMVSISSKQSILYYNTDAQVPLRSIRILWKAGSSWFEGNYLFNSDYSIVYYSMSNEISKKPSIETLNNNNKKVLQIVFAIVICAI
jgi:hypothetical protein